jgi:hypothetical protein
MLKPLKAMALGASLLATAGCLDDLSSTTTSGPQFEEIAARNALLFTTVDTVVTVPVGQVKSRLRQLAAQCIDGVGSVTTISSGAGAGFRSGSIARAYQSRVDNEAGVDRFIVILNNEGGSPTIVVSTKIIAQPSGATLLSTVHGRTFDLFHSAAVNWANGSQTGCPQFR